MLREAVGFFSIVDVEREGYVTLGFKIVDVETGKILYYSVSKGEGGGEKVHKALAGNLENPFKIPIYDHPELYFYPSPVSFGCPTRWACSCVFRKENCGKIAKQDRTLLCG
jgi:hypothetical protein